MVAKKVLISGPVNGKFSALFKRVAAVNKSNGPFQALFCVGSFFGPEGKEAGGDSLGELEGYISGALKVPVPTYFLGAYGQNSERALQALGKVGEAVGIQWLGRCGIRDVQGLSIAYLDGTYDASAFREALPSAAWAPCPHYTTDDVAALQSLVRSASGDVDMFLTCEWPAGVTNRLPKGAVPPEIDDSGTEVIAQLAMEVRPRYHFAAGKAVFFARQPYFNADLGAGAHVTRFIGVAEVGNPTKQKSLHALALTPAAQMDVAELQQKPEDTMPSPYEATSGSKRGLPEDDSGLGEQTWRWQTKRQRVKGSEAAPSLGRPDVVKDEKKTVYVKNLPFTATEDDIEAFFSKAGKVVDIRRGTNSEGMLHGFGFVQMETIGAAERALELNGEELMGRELFVDSAVTGETLAARGQPVGSCWFCLSNPDADVNLIASIGEECYVACDKGQINPFHILILPVEHQPSTLAMSPSSYAEMERYLSALRSCFASQGQVLVGFERYMSFRGIGGNHCQLNVIAVPRSADVGAQREFQESAEREGFSLMEVPGPQKGEAGRDALRELVGDGEYFMALLPDGSRLVQRLTKSTKHPISFGRQVLATLAGVPERADWKLCKVSPKEEEARTEAFKKVFKPYDIMQ